MPELPEVETVRRGLDPLLRGRAIEEADIMDGRLTAPEDPVAVGAELYGEAFTGVGGEASTCSSSSTPAARSSSTCG